MSYFTIKILVALFFWYITIPLLIIGFVFHLFGISISIFKDLENKQQEKKAQEKLKKIEEDLNELIEDFKLDYGSTGLQKKIISVLSSQFREDAAIQTNIKKFVSSIYYESFLLVCKNPYDSRLSKFLLDTEFYYCKLINNENSLVKRRDTSVVRKFLIELQEEDLFTYDCFIDQLEDLEPGFLVHEYIYVMLEKFLASQYENHNALQVYLKISEWIASITHQVLKEKILKRFDEMPHILEEIEEMKFHIYLLNKKSNMDQVFQFTEQLSEYVRYRGDNYVEEKLFQYKQQFITDLVFILLDLIEGNPQDKELHEHLINLLPKTYHMDSEDIYQRSLRIYSSSELQNDLKVLVLKIGRYNFARKRWFKKLKPEDEQAIQNDILMRSK